MSQPNRMGNGMVKLPTGTVTLLFTDIEGSTRLLHFLGPRYREALEHHRALLREAFSSQGGGEVDTQGDALFFAFPTPQGALHAAVQAQRALQDYPWPQGAQLRVRMGIHTGTPEVTHEGYVGADVHLGARICAAAWGGQILVSPTTAALISSAPEDLSLRSLGPHVLKDIDHPVELFHVLAPGLQTDFPPPRTTRSHPTNLPARPQPLIGRDQELSTLTELLTTEEVSLVTLTGPGGTGKTRLALATGQALLDSFPDGVFFVDLSATTDPDLVVPSIAQALSLRETPGRSLTGTLTDHLAGKEMLLVLDNLEQVIAAAPDIASLLSSAPRLKVLASSREPLRVAGERELVLAPLSLPGPTASPQDIAAAAAVQLFLARAQEVVPGFDVTTEDAPTVAEICRRLDGLPLALELAAARVKVLSLAALNDRLVQGLKVLTSTRRDATERQRTLKGAIAWSYDLLTQDEQTLFRRLGIFAGGFSLEAAEQVCDGGDLDTDVLDALSSLVDKSLMRTDDLRERFSMLETIREFALEQLEDSGEADEIRRAHAEFFRALAAESYPAFAGAHQLATLAVLRREQENLRAALEWATGAQSWIALDLCSNLWPFWRIDGQVAEGRKWLERSLQVSDAPPIVRARALRGLSVIAERQHDYESARAAAVEAMVLFEQRQDEAGVARCLEMLASLAEEVGDYDEAVRHYSRTREISEKLGNRHGVAVTVANLANVALLRQDYDAALDLIRKSKQLFAEQGDIDGMAVSSLNEGLALLGSGRPSESRPCLRRALANAKQLDHKELMATALEGLAAEGTLTGDAERAALLLGAASHFRSDENTLRDRLEERLYEEALRRVRQALVAHEFDRLFRDGRRQATETVVAEAKSSYSNPSVDAKTTRD